MSADLSNVVCRYTIIISSLTEGYILGFSPEKYTDEEEGGSREPCVMNLTTGESGVKQKFQSGLPHLLSPAP